MAATKNHDYHILPPDVWPIIGATSALALFGGAVMWMHDNPYGKFVLLLGLLGVVVTMFSWWANVIRESHEGHHTPVVQLHLRYGMILFIASEVMFFVAWFWAFFSSALFPVPLEWITAADGTGSVQPITDAAVAATWPMKGIEVLDPFGFPLLNTFILLCSGTTVTWAHHAMIHGHRGGEMKGLWGALGVGENDGLKKGLWLTIALGLLFTSIQAYEYIHAPFAFKGNIYGATFFMATGFHGAHVIIGTIFLIVCLVRAYKPGEFTPQHHFGFEAAAWYWHFVDVVWLFLFVSIYVWGGWGAPTHG